MFRDRDRAGIEPRRIARRRTSSLLLSRQVLLLTAALLVAAVVIVAGDQALLHLTGHHWSDTTYGFLLGAAVVSVPWAMWSGVTLIDGSWSWRVGAQAERLTADVLRHLGPGWRFHYNMVFYGGKIESRTWTTDIDFVAVGPAGILAVSTKWTGDSWDLSDPSDDWVVAAARGADRNASTLAGVIRHLAPSARVEPVVVCWGPTLDPIPDGVTVVTIQGCTAQVKVVYGPQHDEWLGRLGTGAITDAEITAVSDYVSKRISDYEDLLSRTTAAKEAAVDLSRRARLMAATAAAIDLVAVAALVSTLVSASANRGVARFVRYGRGLGAVVFILLPLAAPLAVAVVSWRADRRSVRARVKTTAHRDLAASLACAVAWVLTVIAGSRPPSPTSLKRRRGTQQCPLHEGLFSDSRGVPMRQRTRRPRLSLGWQPGPYRLPQTVALPPGGASQRPAGA